MHITQKTSCASDTEALGYFLAKKLDENGIDTAFIAMRGEMGVGKTAFTRGFCSYFGIKGVKSPTYTVLNEYSGRVNVFHFDFYRIADEDDLYSIGFEDILQRRGFLIGEWSENVDDLLPQGKITVEIKRCALDAGREDEREISIDIPTL